MNFSIIIPCFNEASTILASLNRLKVDATQVEIILVDGGSTDATCSLVADRVDQLIHASKGRAKQMNAGADAATGGVLVFLHADTTLPKNAFQLIEQGLLQGAQWGRFDVNLTGSHPLLTIIASMMNWRSRLSGIATGDQTIFVHKSLFKQIKGFPDIALMEDIALSKRLKRISKPYCISDKVSTSARRWEEFGIFRTILLMWWLRLGYFVGVSPTLLQQLYSGGRFWKP